MGDSDGAGARDIAEIDLCRGGQCGSSTVYDNEAVVDEVRREAEILGFWNIEEIHDMNGAGCIIGEIARPHDGGAAVDADLPGVVKRRHYAPAGVEMQGTGGAVELDAARVAVDARAENRGHAAVAGAGPDEAGIVERCAGQIELRHAAAVVQPDAFVTDGAGDAGHPLIDEHGIARGRCGGAAPVGCIGP
jgi:hypothetical protein